MQRAWGSVGTHYTYYYYWLLLPVTDRRHTDYLLPLRLPLNALNKIFEISSFKLFFANTAQFVPGQILQSTIIVEVQV
jgi:hypothetical protein